MPPVPEHRICRECNARGSCNNKSADVCIKERRELREARVKYVRPSGLICLAYIGYEYNHNDTSGRGLCIDMFDEHGHCAKCKDLITDNRCPQKRKSPYEPELLKTIVK